MRAIDPETPDTLKAALEKILARINECEYVSSLIIGIETTGAFEIEWFGSSASAQAMLSRLEYRVNEYISERDE